MMKYTLSSICMLVAVFAANAQTAEKSYAGYFTAPMDGRLYPSANFAETRRNHLHSGVDIKTGGVEGKPLYAIADGYVSRIGIAPGGFGRTLYITHPNGTMSVYAHMQKFTSAIERHVKSERYRQKKHNIDLYPDQRAFPVKKGEMIGHSGNSGSSSGPHLHFEMRDAATQEPINPITTGVITMKDDIPPTIVRLHYIEVDSVGRVPVNSRPKSVEVARRSASVYAPKDTAALEVGGKGYFVLEVTDRKNDSNNTMGIYGVAAELDSEPLFGFRLDRFSYADTRYVNSLCHYAMQTGRNQMLRLALQDANRLPIYTRMQNRGLVVINDDRIHTLNIKVEDDTKNISQITLKLKRGPVSFKADAADYSDFMVVDCMRAFNDTFEGLSVSIPERALYESVFYKPKKEDDPALKGGNTASIKRYSPVYTVLNPSIPLHKAMTVSISAPDLPENLRPKACLAILSPDGTNYSYAGGKYANGAVSGNSSAGGRFCVVADDVPPTVTPNFTNGQNLGGKQSVSFTLKDNFSGVASFTATIDGKWIIFERNIMNGTITHNFDPEQIVYSGGKHSLVLTVTDNKGNSTTVKRDFVR